MLTKKCNVCCENVLRVIAVKALGSPVMLVTESTISPKNGCKYFLKIPCSIIPIAPITAISPIVVIVNDEEIPLQNIIGNDVYSDQFRCFNRDNCGNIILRLVYGSTPTHFKVISEPLCYSDAYGTPSLKFKNAKPKKATAKDEE